MVLVTAWCCQAPSLYLLWAWPCFVLLTKPIDKAPNWFIGMASAYSNSLVQDWSMSTANTLEILQSCTKPLIYNDSVMFWLFSSSHDIQFSNQFVQCDIFQWQQSIYDSIWQPTENKLHLYQNAYHLIGSSLCSWLIKQAKTNAHFSEVFNCIMRSDECCRWPSIMRSDGCCRWPSIMRSDGCCRWPSIMQSYGWTPGPVFCLFIGVRSDYAQPITGQVTEVTWPVIGRAQPKLTPSRRQKTGPGLKAPHKVYNIGDASTQGGVYA